MSKTIVLLQLNGSMAPINIAPDVLDCHREGSMHYPGYYRPCEKYNVEKRWQNYLTDLSEALPKYLFSTQETDC